MVNFGEILQNASNNSPWRDYYLNYDGLKKVLDDHPKDNKRRRNLSWASMSSYQSITEDAIGDKATMLPISKRPLELKLDSSSSNIEEAFVRLPPITAKFLLLLDLEIEKVALFALEQQGKVAGEISEARGWFRQLAQRFDLNEASFDVNDSLSPTMGQIFDIENRFYEVGVHLLRLLHFIDMNVQAIRKILKKHDKLLPLYKLSTAILKSIEPRQKQRSQGEKESLSKISTVVSLVTSRSNEMLQPLLRDEGFGTLIAALQHSFREISEYHCMRAPDVEGIDFLKMMTAEANKISPDKGLKRIASTGSLWQSSTSRSIDCFSQRSSTGKLRPIKNDTNHNIFTKCDVVMFQILAARDRLVKTKTFVSFIATGFDIRFPSKVEDDNGNFLDMPMDETGLEDGTKQNEKILQMMREKHKEVNSRTPRQKISDYLNLLSTFLYMTNYYIVAPTSASYAWRLGGTVSMSTLIIGMTPAAALVSTILYSWWTSRSYKAALVFASTCSVIGNLLYAMALPCNSISMVMVGRLLNGFGSARSINRRYIADVFSKEQRTAAAAVFVTAGALGMAAGPLSASLLNELTVGSQSLYWQSENSPGSFMFVLWTMYLMCLLFFFEDPKKNDTTGTATVNDKTPLLDLNKTPNGTTTSVAPDFANKNAAIYSEDDRNMRAIVPAAINLLIFLVIKLCQEAVLSSTPLLTAYYFGWGGTTMGIYLSILGLLMLPVNILVAFLSQTYEDRELIVVMMFAVVVGCIATIHFFQRSTEYKLLQYVVGSIIVIVSSTSLEGPSMSLLSKTIPRSWSKGIINVGLLATEAGTFGRVLADIFLGIVSAGGLQQLLNRTFGSFAVVTGGCLLVIFHFYDYMESVEDD